MKHIITSVNTDFENKTIRTFVDNLQDYNGTHANVTVAEPVNNYIANSQKGFNYNKNSVSDEITSYTDVQDDGVTNIVTSLNAPYLLK